MNKKLLREKNLELRKKLNKKEASNIIVNKTLNFEPFLSAKNILIYYPLKYEIDLLELLKIKNKNFYLPKVQNDELLICPYSGNLKKSDFGVMEPCEDNLKDISLIDIAFIPALAYDIEFNRLGYGKGFYDRLFAKKEFRALKIGVNYKELIIEKIDTNNFDKKVDFIITD